MMICGLHGTLKDFDRGGRVISRRRCSILSSWTDLG